MAGVTEGGGGSYDYRQSLLPTDGLPLRLEGMKGGGPASDDIITEAIKLLGDALATSNLRMELTFEGPLENGNPTRMCITVYQGANNTSDDNNVPDLDPINNTHTNAGAEAKRIADEAEAKRIADEAEAKRIANEAEAKRIADEAEAKRIANEAEAKRLAEEAEAKRLAEEAEAKRLAEEAEAKRIAEEAEKADIDVVIGSIGTLINHIENDFKNILKPDIYTELNEHVSGLTIYVDKLCPTTSTPDIERHSLYIQEKMKPLETTFGLLFTSKEYIPIHSTIVIQGHEDTEKALLSNYFKIKTIAEKGVEGTCQKNATGAGKTAIARVKDKSDVVYTIKLMNEYISTIFGVLANFTESNPDRPIFMQFLTFITDHINDFCNSKYNDTINDYVKESFRAIHETYSNIFTNPITRRKLDEIQSSKNANYLYTILATQFRKSKYISENGTGMCPEDEELEKIPIPAKRTSGGTRKAHRKLRKAHVTRKKRSHA